MKKYIYISLNSVKTMLIYRLNFFIGIISNLISMSISIFIWFAIYKSGSNANIAGMSINNMIIYLITVNLIPIIFSNESVLRMSLLIRHGKLSQLLLRPISIRNEFIFNELGRKLLPFIFVIVILILMFLINLDGYYFMVGILFILNFIMYTLMVATIGNFGFWLLQVWPLRPMLNSLFLFFGGLLFPLHLLNHDLFSIIKWNPFSLVGYIQALAFQHLLLSEHLAIGIVFSLIWILFWNIMYNFTLKKGLIRYEGMGS